MMDAVYVCRPGENEELRYSLRSLAQHVNHDNVWIFGSAPLWVCRARVVERPRIGSRFDTVTAHIAAACAHPGVSDPFMLWNDDFYAVEPIGDMPLLHRGPLSEMVARFGRRSDEWGRGLHQTQALLERVADAPGQLISYELHAPLIVKKTEMQNALRAIEEDHISSSHRRTVYGNFARLGGEQIMDPKMSSRLWPTGPWVSSTPGNFRKCALPRLQALFPDPGPYETPI